MDGSLEHDLFHSHASDQVNPRIGQMVEQEIGRAGFAANMQSRAALAREALVTCIPGC